MPYKPKRPCFIQGCPNLIAIGQTYCIEHQKKDTRPHAASRGYSSKWQKIREKYLRVYKNCAKCGYLAVDVHHIIPLKQGGTLCRKCHRILTAGSQHSTEVKETDRFPVIG